MKNTTIILSIIIPTYIEFGKVVSGLQLLLPQNEWIVNAAKLLVLFLIKRIVKYCKNQQLQHRECCGGWNHSAYSFKPLKMFTISGTLFITTQELHDEHCKIKGVILTQWLINFGIHPNALNKVWAEVDKNCFHILSPICHKNMKVISSSLLLLTSRIKWWSLQKWQVSLWHKT